MKDADKTRAQLLEELTGLRRELDDIQAFADPEWRRLEKWRQSFAQLQEMLEGLAVRVGMRILTK